MLRSVVAEALGTALLLTAVVGSGIMAERLAGGNAALALLANAIATGAALFGLIAVFAPVSGAQFNPAVTLTLAVRGEVTLALAGAHILAQIVGAISGVILAHALFSSPLLEVSIHDRSGPAQGLSEGVATFGLILFILGGRRYGPLALAAIVALFIVGAYWFTASTAFANPAVTLARALTDTFAGIAPASVPGFLLGQAAGGALAAFVASWLFPRENTA